MVDPKFAFRIKIKMATWLQLEEGEKAKLTVAGFPAIEATVTKEARPLGKWVVLKCGGYLNAAEAKSAGIKFQNILSVNGAVNKLGIDVGHSKSTLQFSDQIHRAVRNQTGRELISEIHGLSVFEEDAVTFILFEGHASGQIAVESFSELLLGAAEIVKSPNERQLTCAALINDSFFAASNEAQFILRVSAVEALCEQNNLDVEYTAAVDQLVEHISNLNVTVSCRTHLEDRIGNLKRNGVLRSIENKITDLLDANTWRTFKNLYSKRSQFLHDGKWRGELAEATSLSLEIATNLLACDLARSMNLTSPPTSPMSATS